MIDLRVSPIVDKNATSDQLDNALRVLNNQLAKAERNYLLALRDLAKRIRSADEVDDRSAINGFKVALLGKVDKKFLPSPIVNQSVFEGIQRRLLILIEIASPCLLDIAGRVETVEDRRDDVKAVKAVNAAWREPPTVSFEVKQISPDEINTVWKNLVVYNRIFTEAGLTLAGIVATKTPEDNKLAVSKITEILSLYSQHLQTEE